MLEVQTKELTFNDVIEEGSQEFTIEFSNDLASEPALTLQGWGLGYDEKHNVKSLKVSTKVEAWGGNALEGKVAYELSVNGYDRKISGFVRVCAIGEVKEG